MLFVLFCCPPHVQRAFVLRCMQQTSCCQPEGLANSRHGPSQNSCSRRGRPEYSPYWSRADELRNQRPSRIRRLEQKKKNEKPGCPIASIIGLC